MDSSGSRNKNNQEVWSSPSDPIYFEVDASQEKLETMSKANAMNFSRLSQNLTHSDSPYSMETISTTSNFPQDAKMIHSDLFLNCSPCEEESLNPLDVKRTSQQAFKIHYLLAQLARLLTCQDISNPDAEHVKESEKVSDTMLQKLKSFHLKKKNLDEELQKHKDRIATFRELIANEKAFQDQVINVTDFDSNEAKNVKDAPTLLGVKLDRYHSLNEELTILIEKLGKLLESKEDHCSRLTEENDKYQRHLGNLTNKVTSYEEIIECADQRLKISHSQIAHLEERNKHLEDLIRRPRDIARKPKPRRLEKHLKSMTEMPDILERNGNDLD
ncbi:cancer-associated gene 1 protein isoform 3-T3 [Molossus nigricans]